MTISNTMLTKIPTEWPPQLLDCIIEQKESWIEYEKLNQDDSFSITEEKKDISICKHIKRNCKGKDVISFNHVEEELQFLDMLRYVSDHLEVMIDGLEEDIQYLGERLNGKVTVNYWTGKIVEMKSDETRRELREAEEGYAYDKLQLEALNKYIEIIDSDKTKRSLLKARHNLEYIEYEAEEKKKALETVKRCDRLIHKQPNNIHAYRQKAYALCILDRKEEMRKCEEEEKARCGDGYVVSPDGKVFTDWRDAAKEVFDEKDKRSKDYKN